MDELIIRSLQGRATPREEEDLRRWRRSDPRNEKEYQKLREIWSVTGAAEPPRDIEVPDHAALIYRAEQEESRSRRSVVHIGDRRGRTSRESRPASTWRRRATLGVIAAGLVAVGFGIGANALRSPEEPTLLARTEIATGAGEMTTVSLGDGTNIRVGPRSRLRLSEDEDERRAWLEGRAFFAVESDASRPFTVETEHGEARVLGTRFEVRSEREDDEFRVMVVEGEVSVRAGGSEVSVTDGQLSRSVGGQRLSTEVVDDVFAQLDWLGDALVFQATPLDRAVGEIERRYGLEIEIEDSTLARMTVTAAFTGQPADEVMLVLCEIVDARCAAEGDTLRIETSPAPAARADDGSGA